MTLGPPPSAAGSSSSAPPTSSATLQSSSTLQHTPPADIPHTSPSSASPSGPYTSHFPVQQPSSRAYHGTASLPAHSTTPSAGQAAQQASSATPYPAQTAYYPQQPPYSGASQPPPGAYSYYGYTPNAWSNAWNSSAYQYHSGGYSYTYNAPQPSIGPPATVAPRQPQATPVSEPQPKAPSRNPSPSPPPEYHKDWDAVIKSFLSSIGFSQALRGFEADMIVLNPEWEQTKIPEALKGLISDLSQMSKGKEIAMNERSLEARKLDNVQHIDGVQPRSHTSITGDISRFLARNRARNDASNRNEFLLSLVEKRRRLNESEDAGMSSAPSCARTDAKTQNRDLQMKYDIAKNEDGPLRRTMQAASSPKTEPSTTSANEAVQDYPSAERYPALDERLQNIEKHFAVRYVPNRPKSLLDRLKFLEDHIVHLEREYPPWAALHFSQPNRGWPPPPRATPIIVPSHLTSTAQSGVGQPIQPSSASVNQMAEGGSMKGKGKERHTKSSLHRAVLEKLEVQKAMHDLAGTQAG